MAHGVPSDWIIEPETWESDDEEEQQPLYESNAPTAGGPARTGTAPVQDEGYVKGLASEFGRVDLNNPNESHTGAWDNDITSEGVAGVALPASDLIKRFGSTKEAQGALVEVRTANGKTGIFPVVDIGPGEGIIARQGPTIDLTYGAARQLGHSGGLDQAEYKILGKTAPMEEGWSVEAESGSQAEQGAPPRGEAVPADWTIQPATQDPHIESLEANVQPVATDFLNKAQDWAASKGLEVRVTEGYRTPERQEELYAQGRTTPGPIVTNARAGQSNHQSARAFDVGIFKEGKQIENDELWNELGQIGKDAGLSWGGDFKSIHDPNHFELLGERPKAAPGTDFQEPGRVGAEHLTPVPNDWSVEPVSATTAEGEVVPATAGPGRADYAPGIGPVPTAGSAAEYHPGVGPGVAGEGVVYDEKGGPRRPLPPSPGKTYHWTEYPGTREAGAPTLRRRSEELPVVTQEMATKLGLTDWRDLASGREVRRAEFAGKGTGVSREDYEAARKEMAISGVEAGATEALSRRDRPYVPGPTEALAKRAEQHPEQLPEATTEGLVKSEAPLANLVPSGVSKFIQGKIIEPAERWLLQRGPGTGYATELSQRAAKEVPGGGLKAIKGIRTGELAVGEQLKEYTTNRYSLMQDPIASAKADIPRLHQELDAQRAKLASMRTRGYTPESQEDQYRYGVGTEGGQRAEQSVYQEEMKKEGELIRTLRQAEDAANGNLGQETFSDKLLNAAGDQMVKEGKRSLPEINKKLEAWNEGWAPYIDKKWDSDGGIQFVEGLSANATPILSSLINSYFGGLMMYGQNVEANEKEITEKLKKAGKPIDERAVREEAHNRARDQTVLEYPGQIFMTRFLGKSLKALPANWGKQTAKVQGQLAKEAAEDILPELVQETLVTTPLQDLISRQRNEAMGISKPLTHEEAAKTTLASMGQAGLQTLAMGAGGMAVSKGGELAGRAAAPKAPPKVPGFAERQQQAKAQMKPGTYRNFAEIPTELPGTPSTTSINVGLNLEDRENALSPEIIHNVLAKEGVKVVTSEVKNSKFGEPTAVVSIARPMNADQAHRVATQLKQEAIAQKTGEFEPSLYGVQAAKWGPYDESAYVSPTVPVTSATTGTATAQKPGEAPTTVAPPTADSTPLQGAPTSVPFKGGTQIKVGPTPELRQSARDYMNKRKAPYTPPTTYVKVNPEDAKATAKAYSEMLDINDPKATPEYKAEVKKSYDAFKAETRAQYDQLVRDGYSFEFHPEGTDPYRITPQFAVQDVKANKKMSVFPTTEGFGTGEKGAPPAHPLLETTGLVWGQRKGDGQFVTKPVTYNDLFRAVHDVYGHAKEGVGFRADGEDNAYLSHSAMYSPEAKKAMAAETRGQNSWVNYGPHGQYNRKATGERTWFAPQKAGILPQEHVDRGVAESRAAGPTIPPTAPAKPAPTIPPEPAAPRAPEEEGPMTQAEREAKVAGYEEKAKGKGTPKTTKEKVLKNRGKKAKPQAEGTATIGVGRDKRTRRYHLPSTEYERIHGELEDMTDDEFWDAAGHILTKYEKEFNKMPHDGIEEDYGFPGTAAVLFTPQGKVTFVYNPTSVVARELVAQKKGVAPMTVTNAVIGEEQVHNAWVNSLKADWEKIALGGPTFTRHVREQIMDLAKDMKNTIDKAPADEQKALYEAVAASWNIYDTLFDTLTADMVNDGRMILENIADEVMGWPSTLQFGAEFLRQAHQAKKNGAITEETRKTVFETIGKWVQKALDRIYKTFPGIQEGKYGTLVQEHLQRIEDGLAGKDVPAHDMVALPKGAKYTIGEQAGEEEGGVIGAEPGEKRHPEQGPTVRPFLQYGSPEESAFKGRQVYREEREAGRSRIVAGKFAFDEYMSNLLDINTDAFWENTQDKFKNMPGLGFLSDAMRKQIDRRSALAGKYGSQIDKVRSSVASWNRKTADTEYGKYWRLNQTKGRAVASKYYDTMSEGGKKFVDLSHKLYPDMGSYAANMTPRLKIKNSETGRWEDFQEYKSDFKDYHPHRLQERFRKAMDDPDRYPSAWNEMMKILQGEGRTKAQAETELTAYQQADAENGFFGSLERKRVADLPSQLYDYSFAGLTDYVARFADRIAQVEAFGQGKGKENTGTVWDEAIKRAGNDQTRDYIRDVMNQAYGQRAKHAWERWMMTGGTFLSGIHLGNQASAFANLVSGEAMNMGNAGFLRWVRTLPSGFSGFGKDLYDRGILQRDFYNLMHDGEQGSTPKLVRGFTKRMLSGDFGIGNIPYARRIPGVSHALRTVSGVLKGTSQTAAEAWVRGHSTGIAKSIMRDAIKQFEKDPRSRASREHLAYFKHLGFGGTEGQDLIAEGGEGELFDRFLRESVVDVQAGYTYNRLPLFMSTPAGKIFGKYGPWGLEQLSRFQNRVTKPAVRALTLGQLYQETVHFVNEAGEQETMKVPGNLMPLARYLVALALGGLGIEWGKEKLFGTPKRTATLAQILAKLNKDDMEGLVMAAEKSFMYLVSAGAGGTMGTGLQFGMDVANRSRGKNPLNAPAVATLEDMAYTLRDITDQGVTSEGTRRSLLEFTKRNWGLVRSTTGLANMPGRIDNAWSAPVPFLRKQAALQDASWLKVKTRQYDKEHAVRAPLISERPTKTPTSALKENVYENVLIGDPLAAREAIREYKTGKSSAEKAAIDEQMKDMLQSRHPIRAGGGSGGPGRVDFIKWLKKQQAPELGTVPGIGDLTGAEDVARVQRIDKDYRKNARKVYNDVFKEAVPKAKNLSDYMRRMDLNRKINKQETLEETFPVPITAPELFRSIVWQK